MIPSDSNRKACSRSLKKRWGSKSFRKKMIKAAILTGKRRVGELHPRWKGGSWSNWKRRVKEQDDYTCQRCGLREPEIMHADHIKSIRDHPELAFEVSNGITLCPNCHARKTVQNKETTNKKYIK